MILFIEGNLLVRENMGGYLGVAIKGSNLEDLIYQIFYTDIEYEIVVLGDDLTTKIDPTEWAETTEVGEEMEQLVDCDYFPVALGEVCKRLARKRGKKEPRIVIFSTFESYSFKCKKDDIFTYITDHQMEYVRKTENIDGKLTDMISDMTKNQEENIV